MYLKHTKMTWEGFLTVFNLLNYLAVIPPIGSCDALGLP